MSTTKDKTKRQAYYKNHYKNNKEYYLNRNRLRGEEFQKFAIEQKGNICSECNGTFHSCQLDFDHVRGTKKFTIARKRTITSKEALIKEIAKCEVVCANCHRLRTYKRLNGESSN